MNADRPVSPPVSLHRLWKLAALLALALVAKSLTENFRDAIPMDFVSYWAAAKLALIGDPAAAYDIARHRAIEGQAVAMGRDYMPFAYPPAYLLLLLPFGLPPYPIAALAWIAAGFTTVLLALRRLVPGIGAMAIAFPPVMACAILGQNGLVIAALFIAAMWLLPARPFLAGMLLGGLVIKPHLALLVPLALIAGREWRAFAGAAASILGLCALALLSFGLSAWVGFVTGLPLFGSLAASGMTGWQKMASVHAALRLAGVPGGIAFGLHAVVAIAGAILLWRIWRRTIDPLARGAALVGASVLVSPYLYVYDQVPLILAIGFLWRRGVPQGALAALFLIPLASILAATIDGAWINPAPLLPIILLVLIRQAVFARPPD